MFVLRSVDVKIKMERSTIWKYFDFVPDTNKRKAKCKACGTVLSRGTNLAKLGNSSLHNHLKLKHAKLSTEKEEEEKRLSTAKRKREENQFLETTKKARLEKQATLTGLAAAASRSLMLRIQDSRGS